MTDANVWWPDYSLPAKTDNQPDQPKVKDPDNTVNWPEHPLPDPIGDQLYGRSSQ